MPPEYDKLSDQEKKVLRMKDQGKTNDAVARELGISVGRIEAVLTHARSKLRAKTTPQAIQNAKKAGLL
jgi:DNA-binding CsgD family transcriptional regulator